jgi:hypothetical protein
MSFRLLKLTLTRPIRYRDIPPASIPGEAADEEIQDQADFYELDAIRIEDGLNGPSAAWPPARGPAHRCVAPEPATGGEDKIGQRDILPGEYALAPGEYALAQAPGDADPGALSREFFREAWWRGVALESPFIVRRVREDGKAALQLLCPARFPAGADS